MKYTPERVDALVELIETGLPILRACDAVGISHQTYYNWKKEFEDFDCRIREAESNLMKELIEQVKAAAKDGDPKSQQWMLERRFPTDFGKADRLQLQGDAEKPINLQALISRMNGNSKAD